MKNLKLLFILHLFISPLYSQNNQTMAYYTDLSETINGEKYMSIYSFKKKYILGELLRDLSDEKIKTLLKNRNVKYRISNVKLEENAILDDGDRFPDELYPLSALNNLNSKLILANIEISDKHCLIRLDSLGYIFIYDKFIAKITNNSKFFDQENNLLATITSDFFLKDSLNNNLIQINKDGTYSEKGKKSSVTFRVWPLDYELKRTGTAIYYLFVVRNVLNLNFQELKKENK